MGSCGSKKAAGSDDKSRAVDEYLHKEAELQNLTFKVLLLGAGETGKSTVVKQLKLLYKIPTDDIEVENYASNIHKNCVQCMQVFIDAAANLHLEFSNPEDKKKAEEVSAFVFDIDTSRMPPHFGQLISDLWKTEVIQNAYSHRSEFWFLDASEYYFSNVLRIAEDGYVPTEDDIVMTRIRTTGISLTDIDDGPVHFKIVDVGGQRNERKKWMHCFDDVKCLLFVVNLAGYDQVMFEDPTQNRMQESLSLFAQICNNPVFAGAPIFLLLNKKDIFEEMLRKTPLSKCFPTYTGTNDVNPAIDYITHQFKLKLQDPNKTLHTMAIAARFRRDVKDAWNEIKSTLQEDNKANVQRAQKRLKDMENPPPKV